MEEVEHLIERKKPEVTTDLRNIPSNLASTLRDAESMEDERRFYEFMGDKIIEDSKRKAAKDGARQIAVTIAEGDAARQIVRHANDEQAELIVMGTRGLGEIKGLLIGSAAHKVTQLAILAPKR